MKCNQYMDKTLGESSIHGFPYLVKRRLHWMEKIFWLLMITLAAYTSIDICLNQWKRFRDNPIVYAMELAWGKSNFPFVGITLCSDYVDQHEFEHIIEDMWHVEREQNETAFQYYWEFLKVLNRLYITNMENLRPYENDTRLNDLNFLQMLIRMRQKVLPEKVLANADDSKPSTDVEVREMSYAAAITESGLCRTTSQLTKYTNPFGDLKPLKVSNRRYCDIMNECNTKIYPKVGDDTSLYIYLHNVEDVLVPLDPGTIIRRATMDGSLTIELLLSLTTAETEVRNLPIAYRKCRYKDENILKYFEIYRPGLCRIECRINAAFKKCGCKPYFYVVAQHIPVCDIKGMLCLSKQNWPHSVKCNCLNLCQEAQFIGVQTTLQKDDSTKFERTIIVKLFLPRMAMKRRVVFSTDQLIMSFGGAIGLFLGASFISIYGLLFVLSEFVFSNCWSLLKREKRIKLVGEDNEGGEQQKPPLQVGTRITMVGQRY
ncbi:pickpocket 25 [Musca autumnalis]|uniref:pickpocket 25 n=1 Tax=Musca autumnalis TaxID=221902 RepID=UPI003CF8B1CC